MRRVTIVGCIGAGKSTFALSLGRVLGLEVVHLDLIFLPPNGIKHVRKQREAGLAAVFQRQEFILEGAHRWTFAHRIAQCDTVIWLDIPPHRRLINILRRKYAREAPIGQHVDPSLARLRVSSIPSPVQILRDQFQDAALLQPIFDNPPDGLRVIRLRNLAQTRDFLDSLQK